MCFEEGGVVRRIEKIPGCRPVMRNDLSYDRFAQSGFTRVLSQRDMNIVVGATKQVALNALTITFSQRVVLINIRVSSIEDISDKRDCLAFTKFCPVAERNDVGEFCAARRRLAPGNGRLVVTGIAQFAERLQRHGRNFRYRRAEIILHGILLIIGRALETAGVAAEKINSLRFISERFELERKRLAASLELHFLSIDTRG